VVLGLANAGQWSLGQVLIMSEVDDRHRGRVMSINMMIFGLMPFAVIPAAFAADAVGAPLVFGVFGVGLLAFTALVLLTQARVRRLP
jgi:MFS family permease